MQEREGLSKRVASEQKVQQTYPDGLGFRIHPEGDENLAFVYDYKAAHKFTVEDLKPALAKESYLWRSFNGPTAMRSRLILK